MTATPESLPTQPPLRLHGPAQIVAALPYLLGFRPSNSLVVIGLRDGRVIDLTMRADLPPAADEPALVDWLTQQLLRHGLDLAVVVVVADGRGRAGPRPSLAAMTRRAFAAAEVTVLDLLWLRRGRWRSYLCTDDTCCPREGRAVDPDEAGEVAAVTAWSGEVVHESRDDLAALLDPVVGASAASMRSAVRRAVRATPAAGPEATGRLVAALVGRSRGGDTSATDAEVAAAAVGLAVLQARDEAVCWAGGESARAAESVWMMLVRRAPPPYDVAPATLLAAYAYIRGNGALARIALDRALAGDPTYSLAHLLSDGLDYGIPPRALAEAFGCYHAAEIDP